MINVGVNLLWMVPGVVGGSETYTTRLLHGLSERPSDIHYTLFALPQFASAHPDLVSKFDFETALYIVDHRRNYSETRYRALGKLNNRVHALVFTETETGIRVIIFRKANSREVKLYEKETDKN